MNYKQETVKSCKWFNDCHNILELCYCIFSQYRSMPQSSWNLVLRVTQIHHWN